MLPVVVAQGVPRLLLGSRTFTKHNISNLVWKIYNFIPLFMGNISWFIRILRSLTSIGVLKHNKWIINGEKVRDGNYILYIVINNCFYFYLHVSDDDWKIAQHMSTWMPTQYYGSMGTRIPTSPVGSNLYIYAQLSS